VIIDQLLAIKSRKTSGVTLDGKKQMKWWRFPPNQFARAFGC